MLFATQNPPGLYGGRKPLSRAFRNRFIELKFDDIPTDELKEILQKRCQLAPTHAEKLVAIMGDLQVSLCVSAAAAASDVVVVMCVVYY